MAKYFRAFKQNDLFRPDFDRIDFNACVGDNGGPYDLYDYAYGYFDATRLLLKSVGRTGSVNELLDLSDLSEFPARGRAVHQVPDFGPCETHPVQRKIPRGSFARAFDEKVESMIVDSHDGANRIQDPHWNKGASHEWGSLIPTICVNVWLRQSKPVIPA